MVIIYSNLAFVVEYPIFHEYRAAAAVDFGLSWIKFKIYSPHKKYKKKNNIECGVLLERKELLHIKQPPPKYKKTTNE